MNRDAWIQWGRFIRGSPCSAELLSGVKEFVPPEEPVVYWDVHQDKECHNVIQWLKVRCAIPFCHPHDANLLFSQRFPEPPLEEIRRWEMLFLDEQRKSCEHDPDYQPPTDCEERWREYNEEFPE